jgi:hypothetical protein
MLFVGNLASLSEHEAVDVHYFPVSLLIMVAILSAKLPTSFGRAILVTLCYMLIEALVVGILVVIAIILVVIAIILFGAALKGSGI